jgi:hypothetical protein
MSARIVRWVMAAGLVVGATLVVVLSQRLTRLTHAYQVLQRRASTLTTGEVVPDLPGGDIDRRHADRW